VTGRKTDYWLVRTVGLLAAVIGGALLVGTRHDRPSPETKILGVATGASFTALDLVYVVRGRVGPIYLGDAAVHGLLAGWALLASAEDALSGAAVGLSGAKRRWFGCRKRDT
jgi:hypothetical protein